MARVAGLEIEVITTATADKARVATFEVEAISGADASTARVADFVVEAITTKPTTQVYGFQVEALTTADANKVRTAAFDVEALTTADADTSRVAGFVVEAVTTQPHVRVAALAVEALTTADANTARVAGLVVEAVTTPPHTRVAGLAVEVIVRFSAFDPPFVPRPVPKAYGGTLLPNRRDGVWLLDFDIGGQRYRFGTREVSIASRDLGTNAVFVAGLIAPQPAVDPEAVSVTVVSEVPWAETRARVGPFSGRDFLLRYWYEGQVLEDAYIVLQGCVTGSKFADIGGPLALQLDLKRSEAALSLEMVTAKMVLNDGTWGGSNFDPTVEGAGYPIVIGHPGGGLAGTPALYVDGVNHKVLIAGHEVEASQVTITDQTFGGFATISVTTTRDNRSRLVSMCDLTGSGLTVAYGDAYFAGFTQEFGGGVMDGGRVVTGLGDLLIWGSKTFSRAVFDLGMMESLRADLNLYRIDTTINQVGITWEEWLQQNLINLFNLEVVRGPRGIYYRQTKYNVDPDRIRAQLTTSGGSGGMRVARMTEITETTEDIFNQVTVQFGAVGMSSSAYSKSITVGPTRDEDTDQIPDQICALSAQYFRIRPKTIGTLLTWDRPTAYRLARDTILRYALPKLVATYQGSSELFGLRKGETVQVNDTVGGAAFAGELALVTGLAFGAADTTYVTLLFPGESKWVQS